MEFMLGLSTYLLVSFNNPSNFSNSLHIIRDNCMFAVTVTSTDTVHILVAQAGSTALIQMAIQNVAEIDNAGESRFRIYHF